MPGARIVSAARRARAYEAYGRPEIALARIAKELGVSAATFARMRRRWGWPPRAEAMRERDAAEMRRADERRALETGWRDAASALVSATAARIEALSAVADEASPDHDRAARMLASYARTLAAARRLLQQGRRFDAGPDSPETGAPGGPADEGPDPAPEKPQRSLRELRDELARRLERIIAEEEARGRDGLLL